MDDGTSRKTISEPFFSVIIKAKTAVIIALIINNIQFFLKELFTDKAFGDFKMIDEIVSKTITPKIQKV